ncbi:MAG TPA: alginate lyase family protein [Blastocatellia bacterium]|nr:alginate lyase family protein [Blastocatellia bacterium]
MSSLSQRARLVLHTLPHLRWEQIVYRPLRVAQFRAYAAVPQLAARWHTLPEAAPETAAGVSETFRLVFARQFAHYTRPLSECDEMFRDLRAGRFTFLNRTLTIAAPDWNERYESHLWNYQLHYFNCVIPAARALRERGETDVWQFCQQHIESWIAQARIGVSDGWDAYPTSLRVVNWIYAYALLSDCLPDGAFLQKWRTSIYQQLDFLSSHLELHLLANHLLENAKALVIGGLLFADDERGREWLEEGERLLWREFDEQVLPDGGHYERSPMYHALALAGFLECFALLRAFRIKRGLAWTAPTAEIVRRLRAMTRFLEAMTWPDGTLALFNDAANTEEARPLPIIEAAARIVGEEPVFHQPVFPETGYYCWFSRDGSERIVVDAGPPSVDYNAAHAHCDLLSYELWLDGRPFIVDSGVHGYGGDRFREYARSTRAHNTVMFDGQEQSELWGTFRLARRAEMLGVEVSGEAQRWSFEGSCQPYFDRRLIHRRRILRMTNGEWIIEDTMREGRASRAESFIHLHPDISARRCSPDSLAIECQSGDAVFVVEPFGATGVEIVSGSEAPVQGWRFPEFGVAQPAPTICFTYQIEEGRSFGYRISPAR